jgi:hypothetical protein
MSAVYTIESRIHLTRWDPAKQQAVAGWEVTALWAATGTRLPVFIPDDQYNAANVDAAIRQAGYKDEEIGALGASSSS